MRTSRSSGRLTDTPPSRPQGYEKSEQRPIQQKSSRYNYARPTYTNQPQPQQTTQPRRSSQNIQQPRRITDPERRSYTEERKVSSNLHKQANNTHLVKKKKKNVVVPILFAIVLIIGVIGGGYWYLTKDTKPTLENMRPKITELYVDNQKSELKQTTDTETVEKILADVQKIETKESEVAEKDGFINELKSIEAFLTDKEKIEAMADTEYDLDDPNYRTQMTELKASISEYKVAGLRISNLEAVNAIGDEQQSYENLKQALIGVSNGTDVDPTEYMTDIDAKIKHNPNKEKLTNVITLIQDKQGLLEELETLKKDKNKNKSQIDDKNKQLSEVQDKLEEILLPKEE